MKALFVLALLSLSVQSFAQGRPVGRIDLRDGRSTVLISVNERHDLSLRVRLLEEAVRDLQAMVYDLQDRPGTRLERLHVCVLKTTFNGSFIAKASTRVEAEAEARNKCTKASAPFCSSTAVQCEIQDLEIIR